MNNAGAMGLLMPLAANVAKRLGMAAGQVLMPLAFGTMLGGMTILIGTPPNIIVPGFRAEAGPGSFAMFDFAPVALPIAPTGILFMAILGWRLGPERKARGIEHAEDLASKPDHASGDGWRGLWTPASRDFLRAGRAPVHGPEDRAPPIVSTTPSTGLSLSFWVR
jgi:Na+/H+ antiporter NhaD/arsenite permease-like protein